MHSITRITATITATQTVAWPHFAGSTLRGAFGRALRKAACITGQPQCGGCPLRASCAYGTVFDPAPPAAPLHPSFKDGLPSYILQPPALGACQLQPGQHQQFALLLLPGAQTHQRVLEHVLRAATEQHLMQEGQFTLQHIHTDHINIPTPTATATPPAVGTQATLRWRTPLRLQHQGKPVFKPQHLDTNTLVRAMLRRQLQWCQLTKQNPPDSQPLLQAGSACTLNTSNLQWHDIQRHSGSQNQKVPLGGLLGNATLQGPAHAIQALHPLLQLCEQLHVGKETVMGLGRYQLAVDPP
jgi:hypothetical protein